MTPLRLALLVAVLSLGFLIGWVASDLRHAIKSDHGLAIDEHDEVRTPPSPRSDEEKPAPEVRVGVAPLRRRTGQRRLIAFGTVVPAPRTVRTVSLPFECRVARIAAVSGMPVVAGSALLEVALSSDAQSARSESRAALDAARAQVEQVQRLIDLELATLQELQQANAVLAQAVIAERAWSERIDGDTLIVRADADGTVLKISVLEGQLVRLGAELMEISSGGEDEVRFGLEPGDAALLSRGMPVIVADARRANAIVRGSLREVSTALDPDTRLVDAIVTVPFAWAPSGESVRGEFSAPVPETWLVPRPALVSNGAGDRIFTVTNGKAVVHPVTVIACADGDAAVSGDGLREGDPVIVLGNHRLEDGHRVRIAPIP